MNKKYFLLLCTILLATMPACADYVNVTDKLNVRASAQLNSKIIDTLPRNHYVAVQYKNDDWAYIEYYSKQKYKYGWVKKEYLQPEYVSTKQKYNINKTNTKYTGFTPEQEAEIKYLKPLTYYMQTGDMQKSLVIANRYLIEFPNSFYALDSHALLSKITKNYNDAINSYTKLINSNIPPNQRYGYYFARGLCYVELKKYRQALNDFETLPTTYIYSMPNKAQFNYYYNRGEAECSLFLLNAAILSYTNALEIRQSPDVIVLRGLAYSATYQNDLARQDLNKAINMCKLDQSSLCADIVPVAKLALSDLSKDEATMHRQY